MKTYITTSTTSTTGYAIVDNGITTDINATDPKNERILKLPENSSNRKWYSADKVDKGQNELTFKASIKLGGRHIKPSKEEWTMYLTDEEKDQLEALKELATKRMNDPIEKAKRALEQARKEYEALLEKQQADAIEAVESMDLDDELGELED